MRSSHHILWDLNKSILHSVFGLKQFAIRKRLLDEIILEENYSFTQALHLTNTCQSKRLKVSLH